MIHEIYATFCFGCRRSFINRLRIRFCQTVQLTDILGRKVTVDLPAKRVVLGFYYQDYMAIGGKTALDNVVGFSKAVWADWAPPSWAAFSKAVPKLNQLTDVGECGSRHFLD